MNVKMSDENKTKYLIIGSGRAATHLNHYLELLEFKTHKWNRNQSISELQILLKQSSHVVLAISDSAIESFKNEFLKNTSCVCVHLSGALEVSGVESAHPLMTFGKQLYDLDLYKKIPFIVKQGVSFQRIFPGLSNPFYSLPADKKPFYHALCVVGGNFTGLLWNEMKKNFQNLGLPSDIADLYLRQIVENFIAMGSASLTGPIVRKDFKTINKNILALKNTQLEKLYKCFVDIYFSEFSKLSEQSEQSKSLESRGLHESM